MSAEHRRPVLAFVALALVAAVVVAVHRADARGGPVVAVSVKPEARVAGALAYPTQAVGRETYLWPAFGRLPGAQDSGLTTGPVVVRPAAGAGAAEPASTPDATGLTGATGAPQSVSNKAQPSSPRVGRGGPGMPGRMRPSPAAQAGAASGVGSRRDGSETGTTSLAASAGPRTQTLSAAAPDRRVAGRSVAASGLPAQSRHGHESRGGHKSGRPHKSGRGHKAGRAHKSGRGHKAGRGHRRHGRSRR